MYKLVAPLTLGTMLAAGVTPALAAQSSTISGTVVTGSCERNRVAFDLNDLELPTSRAVGAPGGETAAVSFSTLPISFDDLLAVDHAVIAGEACGLVGGSLSDADFLAISLESDSDEHGIAFLTPSDAGDETNITVFLVPGSGQGTRSGTTSSNGSSRQDQDDAAEAAYLNEASGIMLEMGDSLDRFGALMSDALIDDPDWVQSVIDEVALWNVLLQDLEALDPPPAFADMHETLLDAFILYSDAGADVIDGMRDLDAAKIESAVGKLERANALVDDASAQLDEIQAERGL